MKKLLSILLAVTLALSVGTITVFAQEVQEKYYDENGTLKTVTIDTGVNKPIQLEKSSYTEEDFPKGGLVLEFTEPCVVYAWFSCKNSEQTPGQLYPVDMALDYEMLLGDQNGEYKNNSSPTYGPQYGDYEYLRYIITAQELAAAGGSVSLSWNVRSRRFPDYTVKEVQQKATLGIAAYAGTEPVNNHTAQVKGTYQAGGSASAVYSVDVTWGSLEYVYYANASQGIWNPETHTFEDAAPSGWSCGTGEDQITVTNHSNAAVKADFVFTSNAGYSAVTGSFTGLENNAATLATAVGTSKNEAPSVTTRLALSGELDASTEANTAIGAVTVTISAAQ